MQIARVGSTWISRDGRASQVVPTSRHVLDRFVVDVLQLASWTRLSWTRLSLRVSSIESVSASLLCT